MSLFSWLSLGATGYMLWNNMSAQAANQSVIYNQLPASLQAQWVSVFGKPPAGSTTPPAGTVAPVTVASVTAALPASVQSAVSTVTSSNTPPATGTTG